MPALPRQGKFQDAPRTWQAENFRLNVRNKTNMITYPSMEQTFQPLDQTRQTRAHVRRRGEELRQRFNHILAGSEIRA